MARCGGCDGTCSSCSGMCVGCSSQMFKYMYRNMPILDVHPIAQMDVRVDVGAAVLMVVLEPVPMDAVITVRMDAILHVLEHVR